ncbi:MAG: CoA transferase [Deltaproteobacteria bacterium]|nr:CoA transferase [Deltaproteobacteria bacterium]
MPARALDGIKVLEYCSLVSGPYCTKIMADLGANVRAGPTAPKSWPTWERMSSRSSRRAKGTRPEKCLPFPKTSPIPKRAGCSSISTPTNGESPWIPKLPEASKFFLNWPKMPTFWWKTCRPGAWKKWGSDTKT